MRHRRITAARHERSAGPLLGLGDIVCAAKGWRQRLNIPPEHETEKRKAHSMISGFTTISQKMMITPIKAGQPKANQQR
jgi:hypothetical protein